MWAFKGEGAISKIVEEFTYLGSTISSTESDVNTGLMKVWIMLSRSYYIDVWSV